MMTNNNKPLLIFPCNYSLKVMGKVNKNFKKDMTLIVKKHVPEIVEQAVSSRISNSGNFISLTFDFKASSKVQLDALYQELTAHPAVLMAL